MIRLPCDAPGAISRAAKVLESGGIVAFPTDTVYGVGASLRHPDAILRIFQVKRRPGEKAIPILLAHVEAVRDVAVEVPEEAMLLANCFWPGPLTIVLRRHPSVPREIGVVKGSVAVRVPDHPVALALIEAAGGMLAVTSANISGGADPLSADDVVAQIGDGVDMILDGGRCPGGVPSTVVDLSSGKMAFLRPGPVTPEDVRRCLERGARR